MSPVAHYFGYGDGGHFLRTRTGVRTLDPNEDFPGFPWTGALCDSTLLKNGKVPDHPDGRVFSTCGGAPIEGTPLRDLWIAFYWWDRSDDARPGSNSGFYVHGFEWADRESAFRFACAEWPDVVKRQLFPLRLVERK